MNGISLEKMASEFLFASLITILFIGGYIVALGIRRMNARAETLILNELREMFIQHGFWIQKTKTVYD